MVKRTSINLDMNLVQEVKAILGTSEATETVHTALGEIVRKEKLRRLANRDLPDLTPQALAQMRRPRAGRA